MFRVRVGTPSLKLSHCTSQLKERRAKLEVFPKVVLDITGLWLAGKEGMEKKMETTKMGYLGTTTRIYLFIPS